MADEITEHILAKPHPKYLTRRQYLTWRTLLDTGANVWLAAEAVSTTAIEHPEWDMDEVRSWDEWERGDSEDGR